MKYKVKIINTATGFTTMTDAVTWEELVQDFPILLKPSMFGTEKFVFGIYQVRENENERQ